MGHPKTSDWLADDAILASGTRGLNMLTEIPRLLHKHYPWTNEFEIGFCDKSDLPTWLSQGWRWLKTEHFDIDNYNEAVGLRFGFGEDGGNIKWRENYLMIMPKDVRRRQIDARNEHSEQTFHAQTEGTQYVSKDDPRGEELRQHDDVVYSEMDEAIIKPGPRPAEPVKRGRRRRT